MPQKERDCPKCGTETEVDADESLRTCTADDCNWCVAISGSGRLGT